MIEIDNNDDYFLVKENNILVKIGKNKFNYELQIINNNEEINITLYNINLIFKIKNNSYISFNLYNNYISFNNGFDIINNDKHHYTTSQIQKAGLLYTNSKIVCSEDYICNINYNSYIIDKIKNNIKLFFLNKINMSYNDFNNILNKYNIRLNKYIYYYKINDEIYNIKLQDIFIHL
jgi:hypothetical protein